MAILYIPETLRQARALANAVRRERLRRLIRGVYTDDLEQDPARIVRDNILAIAARRYPKSYVSHSSAILRGPVDGTLFLSGALDYATTYDLPGVRVISVPALPYPEFIEGETATLVAPSIKADPEPAKVRFSSPLQAIFECMIPTRRYSGRRLPDRTLSEVIDRLGQRDRNRAEAFAKRNALEREYVRFIEMGGTLKPTNEIPAANEFSLFFYGWEIGKLTVLGQGEIRFTYVSEWPFDLSPDLPRRAGAPSYEGPRLPTFLENLLPEGWTEDVIAASYKIAKEDEVGLLRTTHKYLSNVTLRPLPIPEGDLVYDAHRLKLTDVAPQRFAIVPLKEQVGLKPEARELWEDLRERSAVRLSGVQAKLPVALTAGEDGPTLDVGSLRTSCTHILKLPSLTYGNLVENEWACLEIGRRAGLKVPEARVVTFSSESQVPNPALLVERYDIPSAVDLERGGSSLSLFMQQDSATLLGLARRQKYSPSLDAIAKTLLAMRLGSDELNAFLTHVVFSWIIGNGDLHAKNISVLRIMRPGRPGDLPSLERTAYAPQYDLVNTRLVIPGDLFALPVAGKKNNLRWRDFAGLADRWGASIADTRRRIEEIVASTISNLDQVLQESRLPTDVAEKFKRITQTNIKTLGL